MDRRETRRGIIRRMRDLTESQATGSPLPLKKHLTAEKLAGGSHNDYLRSLEEGRAGERKSQEPDGNAGQPKP
jgi:hypothetical protein